MNDANDKNDKKIEIMIYGEKFVFISDESDEYLRELAKYIDLKMSEVFKDKNINAMNLTSSCILFGINIADDLYKLKKSMKKIVSYDSNIKYRNKYEALQREHNDLLNKYSQLKNKYEDK